MHGTLHLIARYGPTIAKVPPRCSREQRRQQESPYPVGRDERGHDPRLIEAQLTALKRQVLIRALRLRRRATY